MQTQFLRIQFEVPYSSKGEGSRIVASCDPLDVHSQGKTEDEAVTHLVEAVQLFLTSCLERGTLDQVLKDCGFSKYIESQPESDHPGEKMINVPLYMLSSAPSAKARTY